MIPTYLNELLGQTDQIRSFIDIQTNFLVECINRNGVNSGLEQLWYSVAESTMVHNKARFSRRGKKRVWGYSQAPVSIDRELLWAKVAKNRVDVDVPSKS
jgi:hypothetical protein